MKISEVKNAFKIADAELIPGTDKVNYKFLKDIKDENGKPVNKDFLSINYPRVYIITSNKIIKKIGGSESKGGIKQTFTIYKDGGLNGQPSDRSIGTWWHIYHELLAGNKIEIYMIFQDHFTADVKGLFGKENKNVAISYRYIEKACLDDYYMNVDPHKFPDWNYQENHQKWPDEVETLTIICKENKGKNYQTGKIANFKAELQKRGFKDTKVTRNYFTNQEILDSIKNSQLKIKKK